MEYSGFNRIDEEPALIGQVSDLFSAPVIPKMVLVGLRLGLQMSEAETEFLKTFRDILERALNNLFVIDFCEQFIPYSSSNNNFKLQFSTGYQFNYRTHEVKESWMSKFRHENPSIFIDLRLIEEYQDDSILIEQIVETKNSLPLQGPIYLVWLIGNVNKTRLLNFYKCTKMDKSSLINIEISTDYQVILGNLKERIKECFEQNRNFYKEASKKYKKLVGGDPVKFQKPWMSSIYYYFKLGVIEEFRGDFQGALKYYHTILAKIKEIIEADSGDQRILMINYLRRFSDICFIRLSFLLFRLNQGTEAEFGLFRYLTFFGNGLSYSDQTLWRYNLSRTFARQLISSFNWSPAEINSKIMRGPAHFFNFAISCAINYLKSSVDGTAFQVQHMILTDLEDALEKASRNSNLVYFVDYLQILLLNQYESFQFDKVQVLPNEAMRCLNYLKEESQYIYKWKGLLLTEILEKSIESAKGQQNYQTAVIDTWRLWNLSHSKFNYQRHRFELFQDWCLIYQQISNESIRLNFPMLPNNILFCNVKFVQETCQILDFCEIELNIYNGGMIDFYPESIGIFFDNIQDYEHEREQHVEQQEYIEPITFICNDNEHKFEIGRIVKFKGVLKPSLISIKAWKQIKISYVTMQLKKPYLALQFDEFCFAYREREQEIYLNQSNYAKTEEQKKMVSEFSKICEKTLKKQLILKVEPVKPKILIEFVDSDVTCGSTVAGLWRQYGQLKITNLTQFPTITNLIFTQENNNLEIHLNANEIKFLKIKIKFTNLQQSKIFINAITKFNLQMIDFKYAEICNFEPVSEEFCSEAIRSIDPFEITLRPKILRRLVNRVKNLNLNRLPVPFLDNEIVTKSLNGPRSVQERVIEKLKFEFIVKSLVEVVWLSLSLSLSMALNSHLDCIKISDYSDNNENFIDDLNNILTSGKPTESTIQRSDQNRDALVLTPEALDLDMELSTKLKAMKFMKRKDDAEERKQTEKDQQKSVERTHWIIEDKTISVATEILKNENIKPKLKFQIEYDNSGQNYSNASGIGRQSYKDFNKELVGTGAAICPTGPINKIPKLQKQKQ